MARVSLKIFANMLLILETNLIYFMAAGITLNQVLSRFAGSCISGILNLGTGCTRNIGRITEACCTILAFIVVTVCIITMLINYRTNYNEGVIHQASVFFINRLSDNSNTLSKCQYYTPACCPCLFSLPLPLTLSLSPLSASVSASALLFLLLLFSLVPYPPHCSVSYSSRPLFIRFPYYLPVFLQYALCLLYSSSLMSSRPPIN